MKTKQSVIDPDIIYNIHYNGLSATYKGKSYSIDEMPFKMSFQKKEALKKEKNELYLKLDVFK